MPHGVHAKNQTAFRLPEGLLASLKGAAKQDGRTATDCVSEAIAEWLSRRAGITTSAAPAKPVSPPRARSRKPREVTAPAARFVAAEEPQPATCPHPPARVHKKLCGACGTYVGTTKGGA